MKKSVKDSGIKVLWKPHYCPNLHLIELYWSSGKGNVSRNYYFGHSVKYTVSYLRDGWYVKPHSTTSGKMDLRVPEDEDAYFVIKVKRLIVSSSFKNQLSAPTIV